MAKRNRGSLAPDRRLIWAQIIHTEEDKKGTDLLKMSNYFDIFVSKIDTRIDSKELIKYWLLENLLQRNLL